MNEQEIKIMIGCLLANRRGDHMIEYQDIKRSFMRYLHISEEQWQKIVDENWPTSALA
jgi:hypothetical protein